MRVLIVQFGDYGDAYRRVQSGGVETYRDQRHSVNFVASLAPEHVVATVGVCDRQHDEELSPHLSSIGISDDLLWDQQRLWPLLDRFDPEAFICRMGNPVALAWAAKKQVPTLPTFAGFFTNKGMWNRLNNWKLRWIIRRCVKPCVANHGLSASRSLRRIGVSPEQIVPWESKRMKPIGEAKAAPPPDRAFQLIFVGSLIESKGVGDCIEAVSIARAARKQVELTIVGPGDANKWTKFAKGLGVEESIHFLGVIPAEGVLTEMRGHDAVIVPSRHDYAEGLPHTIFEALSSRSPLIASDHPSFVERLQPDLDFLRFRAGQPQGLAAQIERLVRDPELYARLSRQSATALGSLYVGIEWSELVGNFIRDPLSASGWARRCSLGALANQDGKTNR
jgi:glycosyltransferase involved in cell wall biosynthesis